MTDTQIRMRASDTERERVATRVQTASVEGRLTLAEAEERLGSVYAAKYADELAELTADLPPETETEPHRRFPSPLRVHAAIVAVLSVLVIVRWILSGTPFFWPVVPLFWLGLTLAVHAAFRSRRRVVQY